MKAMHLRVQGRVQGVGYRYSAAREAQRCGVTGWCRNLADGSVEIWAEGETGTLALFVSWVHQGPPGGRVDSVFSEDVEPAGYSHFEITR